MEKSASETTLDVPSAPDPTSQPDVHIVDWDSPDDTANPRNWSSDKKWLITVLVSCYAFVSPVTSSMPAPVQDEISEQFGITSSAIAAMVTSSFVAAYAVGTLFLGPLSELYGRMRVIQAANIWFLAWNMGCSFAQNEGQIIAFRFLAGLGGSGPQTIAGGVIGDVWRPDERGIPMAVYTFATYTSPVLGPACAAWIAEKAPTWQWVFWSSSILDGVIQIVGIICLKETYAPVLLERKAAVLRRRHHNDTENPTTVQYRTIYDNADRRLGKVLRKSLIRPFVILIHEPIIQLFGAYMAFVYGTMYLFLTTMPLIYQGVYHQSIGIAGLHYFALGIGMVGLSQINAQYIDRVYKYLKNKHGGVDKPEFRLPPMVPATFLLPIGLLITGWTARPDIHWIVPDIGITLIGAGLGLNFQSITIYVIDAFALHAASAYAAVLFIRSLAAFGMPLFAPAMYNALGFGKGDTILACAAIAIGIPAPFLFWFFGERIRNASRFAKHA